MCVNDTSHMLTICRTMSVGFDPAVTHIQKIKRKHHTIPNILIFISISYSYIATKVSISKATQRKKNFLVTSLSFSTCMMEAMLRNKRAVDISTLHALARREIKRGS